MALTLAITYWAARRTRTTEHFFAAGGQVTPWQNGRALAGDFLSAGALLGIAGIGLLTVVLTWLGILGWLIGVVQSAIHATIRAGFAFWRRALLAAPWPLLLSAVTDQV